MATNTTTTKNKTTNTDHLPFLFDKRNYMWMFGGLALILLGFILMSGGKSENPNEFHPEEIYSFTRITLAPLLILAGFAIQVVAIMKKPASAEKEGEPKA